MSFSHAGNPSIVFYSALPSKNIKFIITHSGDWKNSGVWNESVVVPGAQMSHPDIAYNDSDVPLVSSCGSAFKLIFSYCNGSLWKNQKASGSCYLYTSVAVNPVTKMPAIAYYAGSSDKKLYYTEFDGFTWSWGRCVHKEGGYGKSCSLAFNSSGYPGIAYIQDKTGDLWYAWYSGSSWNRMCVDDVSPYKKVPDVSLAYNRSGCPGISYYDGRNGYPGDLKFAFCRDVSPGLWDIENVYSDSDSGIYNSLEFDPVLDMPCIAFYKEEGTSTASGGSLYYCKKGFSPDSNFSYDVYPGDDSIFVSFSDKTFSQIHVNGYHWDFGDNTTYDGRNPPVHHYKYAGEYIVSLNTTNLFGCDKIVKNITINPFSLFFKDKTRGNAPLTVNFADKSLGMPSVWNLSFGDGEYYNTTGFFPERLSHLYKKAGIYDVSLLTDRDGLSDLKICENAVTADLNTSFDTSILSGKAPLTVSFNDTTKGEPESFRWSIDGIYISDEKNFTYTFALPGLYNVTLNASTGPLSCLCSVKVTVNENSSSKIKRPVRDYADTDASSDGYHGIRENEENKMNKSIVYAYDLNAGDIVSFNFSKGSIKKLSVAVRRHIEKIMFEVESGKKPQENYIRRLSPVYEYENISMKWSPESSLVAASVRFDVNKSWLKRYEKNGENVIFKIYNSKRGVWSGLPVETDGCNDDLCSYSARIPKFSYFAISVEKNTLYMPSNTTDLKAFSDKVKGSNAKRNYAAPYGVSG
ncbi:PGF-pre-PGF domain-containing protein [Methanomicrobium sp. W14]|uniref:PKD domain-containing protein n=1 Tax=Methanomicrobium sp. W14 TaxID=2817839 RepID=UPI001AE3AB04|nr:PKD domain-containing protein [Methanomicrobium sp. W14]MBP2133222.1 PGF-pre-PGF domain-containing protein [Methanomicrobium sp. W14]